MTTTLRRTLPRPALRPIEASPWYPADRPPLPGVLVELRTEGYHVVAALVEAATAKKPARWAEWTGDVMRLMPAFDTAAAAWRPRDPAAWRAPLPPPLLRTVAQSCAQAQPMRGHRIDAVRFDAVDAVLDVDSASASQRRRGGRHPRVLWWLNPDDSRLLWAAPGAVTRHDAEGRVMRALTSDNKVFRVDNRMCTSLVDMVAMGVVSVDAMPTVAELEAAQHETPWRPTQRDVSDYPLAMGWFVTLPAAERDVLWLACRRDALPWTEIARKLKANDATTKRRYDRAMDRVVCVANETHLDTKPPSSQTT